MDEVLFSSKRTEWETPLDLFEELNKEFNFTLDPCATSKTAKCAKYFTEEEDGLVQDWSNEIVYVNPPYGTEVIKWVKKSLDEAKKGATVVMLLPARTDTRWFHWYIYNKAEIRFIMGRIKFLIDGEEKDPAPFPSMIVIFKKPNLIDKFKEYAGRRKRNHNSGRGRS